MNTVATAHAWYCMNITKTPASEEDADECQRQLCDFVTYAHTYGGLLCLQSAAMPLP